jgi:hypothetical protein
MKVKVLVSVQFAVTVIDTLQDASSKLHTFEFNRTIPFSILAIAMSSTGLCTLQY